MLTGCSGKGHTLPGSASSSRRVGQSIKVRLYAIIGFLGLLPVLGAAFALFAIVNLTRDNAALDRDASGTIHLEHFQNEPPYPAARR
jgi:hypothetical protein